MSVHGVLSEFARLYKKATYGLRKKLFLIIFTTGVVLILSLSITILSISENYLREEISGQLANQTQQISNIVDSYMNQIIKNAVHISTNPSVTELAIGLFSEQRKYTIYTNIYKMLEYLKSTSQWTEFYIVFTENKNVISTDPNNIFDDYTKKQIEQYSWFDEIINSETNLVLLNDFYMPEDPGYEKIGLAVNIQPIFSSKRVGFVVTSINKAFFSEILKDTSYDVLDFLLITDKNGELIFASNMQQILDNNLDKNALLDIINENKHVFDSNSGNTYVVSVSLAESVGWNIISFSDERILAQNVYRLNTIVILVTSICIILLLWVSYLFSSSLTTPLRRLTKLMHGAEAAKYKVSADIDSNDEIGDLNQEFNNMMKTILENQVLRKEAEINALQQQINPHFLYNTLDSIMSLAAINKNDDIYLMIDRLSKMFRYSISSEANKTVTIKDEIEHVENYISIQKIRFKNKLTAIIEIDEDILACNSLKFILQPIVENAIFHGIEKTPGSGQIILKGYIENDTVVFEIIDNGPGIDEEFLTSLNEYINGEIKTGSFEKTKSIGLKNIQERVQLFYGDEYGIEIQSQIDSGTKVILRIPSWK